MTQAEAIAFITKQLHDAYPDITENLAVNTNFKKDGFLRFDIHDIMQDKDLPLTS